MEALMPPGIRDVGEGILLIEECQEMQKQQAEQQQLEIQKQKVEGDQQIKEKYLALKQAKLQFQIQKDAANLKMKKEG